jgi:lysophospholipase
MVLTSPFIALGGQSVGERRIAALMKLACLLGFGASNVGSHAHPAPFEGNGVTSDRRRFDRNNGIISAVPELALGRPTARWLNETLTAIARVRDQAFLGRINVPTLIIAATRDPIVPAAALEQFDERFRAGHLVAIDGALHEIFQERDILRAQALAAIEAFIPGSGSESDPAPREAIVAGPAKQ